jgi:hypothetical protein
VDDYLFQALRAKCTQNPVAKLSLLLTDDAIISIRGGPEGIIDVPTYTRVRDWLKENPKSIYKGNKYPLEILVEEVVYINSAEELNVGFKDASVDRKTLVAGSIPKDAIIMPMELKPIISQHFLGSYITSEEITPMNCIIYTLVGIRRVDIFGFINHYGRPGFIRRHVYGIERFDEMIEEKVMIGMQKNPTSLEQDYIVIETNLGGGQTLKTVPVSIYLQSFTTGFSVFIVSPLKRNDVIGMTEGENERRDVYFDVLLGALLVNFPLAV